MEAIADPERLLATFDDSRNVGQAPGPDGIRYSDLSRSDAAAACRKLSKCLLDGTYRPHASRPVQIPKLKGGTRQLHLRNVLDRMVSRTLLRALTPIIDPHFADCSWGFRPGRSVGRMLASLIAYIEAHDATFVVVDDVTDAFGHVHRAHTVDLFRQHVADERVNTLIGHVLRGGDQPTEIGIHQGCSMSALALNFSLHHALDMPLSAAYQGNQLRFFRYADDLTAACRSHSEGRRLYAAMEGVLEQAGYHLKGSAQISIINLQRVGASAEVLGHRLQLIDGRVTIRLGRTAWDSLRLRLERAHIEPEPGTALQIVRGWISGHLAAFEGEERDNVLHRILRTAHESGHWELGHASDIRGWMTQAARHWENHRQSALHQVAVVSMRRRGFVSGRSAPTARADSQRAGLCRPRFGVSQAGTVFSRAADPPS